MFWFIAPTTSTVGFVGQLYLDTTNNKTYQCVAVTTENDTTTYTWTQLIRITDKGSSSEYGVVKIAQGRGLDFLSDGGLYVDVAGDVQITNRTIGRPIAAASLNFAVKSALTDANHLTMTESEQTTAQEVLGINTLYGSSAPTTSTVGRFGQIYINTTANTTYQCTAVDTVTPSYTWAKLIRSTDYATSSVGGVAKVSGRGLKMSNGYLSVDRANNNEILAKNNEVNPIAPSYLDYAVKVGVTTNTIALTASEKTSAQSWLGITPRGIARL